MLHRWAASSFLKRPPSGSFPRTSVRGTCNKFSLMPGTSMIHVSSKRSVRSIIFFRARPRNATLQEDLCQLLLGMLIRNMARDLPKPILWKVSDRSGGLLVEWTPFYSTMATAAATVIGLLFVAVQLSAERIAGDQSDRWWAIAFSTFYMFLTVFFLPLSYLSPALKPHGRAVLTLILAAIYVFRMAQTSFWIWHGTFRKRGDRLWETFWIFWGRCLSTSSWDTMLQGLSDQAIRSNG